VPRGAVHDSAGAARRGRDPPGVHLVARHGRRRVVAPDEVAGAGAARGSKPRPRPRHLEPRPPLLLLVAPPVTLPPPPEPKLLYSESATKDQARVSCLLTVIIIGSYYISLVPS
jgi:hypothetical protein